VTAAPAARHGVAVVGCGYWGPNLVRNLSTNPRAEVIGVADLSEPRRKEMARLHRVPVTADYKSLLADGRVEIVFLATPAATHAALVLEALAAGKHVFCEKPLSLNLSDGRKVAAALAKDWAALPGISPRVAVVAGSETLVPGPRLARLVERLSAAARGDAGP